MSLVVGGTNIGTGVAAITSIAGTAANQLLTDDGDATVTSEANLTYDGTDLSVANGNVLHTGPYHKSYFSRGSDSSSGVDYAFSFVFLPNDSSQRPHMMLTVAVVIGRTINGTATGARDTFILSGNNGAGSMILDAHDHTNHASANLNAVSIGKSGLTLTLTYTRTGGYGANNWVMWADAYSYHNVLPNSVTCS